MMKEIKVKLDVLAQSYGLDHLCGAFVDFDNNQLLLSGYRKESQIPPEDEHFATEDAFQEWLFSHSASEAGNPTMQNETRGYNMPGVSGNL